MKICKVVRECVDNVLQIDTQDDIMYFQNKQHADDIVNYLNSTHKFLYDYYSSGNWDYEQLDDQMYPDDMFVEAKDTLYFVDEVEVL